jgi:hypothetical protein
MMNRRRGSVIGPEAQLARASSNGKEPRDLAQVCGEQAVKGLVPTERMTQALKPTDAQRSALDALNEASTRAADYLKANCPAEQALTPPARVAAMEQRLNAMMEAIKIVQPALDNFYGSLTATESALQPAWSAAELIASKQSVLLVAAKKGPGFSRASLFAYLG